MAERDLKKGELVESSSANALAGKSDVFDKMGNEALLAKVAQVEAETGKETPLESKKDLLEQAQQKMAQNQQKVPEPEQRAEVVLKAEALEARDEIVLRLQQMSGTPDQLQAVQGAKSLGEASAKVIELLCNGMAEQDLAALAAYDHDDLLSGKILSPESHLETRGLSANARRLGAFAPALWQLVADQLVAAGLSFGEQDASVVNTEATQIDASGDPRNLSGPLLRVAGVLRAARSSTIV
ncbi:MAG: hypothetical protein H6738_16160 [Alphaproteobacteria bacterium]|nr:hypothetical protein [Alphaproteobacteria bacterium]MCB9698314.1 hypothetical protein [Alphaproteobacteria bacterium]